MNPNWPTTEKNVTSSKWVPVFNQATVKGSERGGEGVGVGAEWKEVCVGVRGGEAPSFKCYVQYTTGLHKNIETVTYNSCF